MSQGGHALSRKPAFDQTLSIETQSQDFFGTVRRRAAQRGEMRLTLAILEDAVRRIGTRQSSRGSAPGIAPGEAEAWMRDRGRGTLFCFENVCTILDLDAEEVRRRFLGRRGRAGHGRRRSVSPIPGYRVPRHPLIFPSLWA